jgi:hypothetical protein
MHRLRLPLTAFLVVVALIDIGGVSHLWRSGWPKRVSLESVQPGVARIETTSIPFTGVDWLILALLIIFHIALFYLLWRAWRHSPIRTE